MLVLSVEIPLLLGIFLPQLNSQGALRTPRYRFVMVNRIEFSAEPTDTYLMNVQYVSSFIAQVAFA